MSKWAIEWIDSRGKSTLVRGHEVVRFKKKKRVIPGFSENEPPMAFETKKEAEKWAKRFKNAYAHRPKFIPVRLEEDT